jgi:hypothetical protein
MLRLAKTLSSVKSIACISSSTSPLTLLYVELCIALALVRAGVAHWFRSGQNLLLDPQPAKGIAIPSTRPYIKSFDRKHFCGGDSPDLIPFWPSDSSSLLSPSTYLSHEHTEPIFSLQS